MEDKTNWKGEWVQQSLQLPDHIAEQFRDYSKASPGGIKHAGAAAICLFLAMRNDVRDAMVRHVVNETWDMPGMLMPSYVLAQALVTLYPALKKAEAEGIVFNDAIDFLRWLAGATDKTWTDIDKEVREGTLRWQIIRILDPELTPPPGEKASDRAKAEPKDKGKKSG
jgi:hypothetical protein